MDQLVAQIPGSPGAAGTQAPPGPNRNVLALSFFRRGQFILAIQEADAALAEAPSDPMAHLSRAFALEGLNRGEEALREYELAARLSPSFAAFHQEALVRSRSPREVETLGKARSDSGAEPASVPVEHIALMALGLIVPWVGWAVWRKGRPRDESQPFVLGGTYRVEKLIGKGGMGMVFEGFDVALQRKVAIKKMDGQSGAPGGDDRLLEEGRLVAGLRHPNIVEIHSVLKEEGVIYQVFEFVAGRPLDKLLTSKGRLEAMEAVHLLGEVGQGLDFAHSRGVVHGDLKPANIMINNEGRAKIMDFGLARKGLNIPGSGDGQIWGTPLYMAPEQEVEPASKESDLYAFAVLAFELLSGSVPFPGPDILEQKLQMILAPLSRRVSGLPPALDGVFQRALAPDPRLRYPSAAEFVRAVMAGL